jgi:hypothetical protein
MLSISKKGRKEAKKLKRKIILGAILTLSLVLSVTLLAIVPAIANSTLRNSNSKSGIAADILLQLPPPGGAPTHPTNFRITFTDADKRTGSGDVMRVDLWVSALNTYVPVALIFDQPMTGQEKMMYNNSALYLEVNGVVIRNNLKEVADKELDVWQDYGSWGNGRYDSGDKTLIATLTVPLQLDFTGLPPIFGASFTIPALEVRFIAIAEGYSIDPIVTNLPSGYVSTIKATAVPAWAFAHIPEWGIHQDSTATIYDKFVITFAPPA